MEFRDLLDIARMLKAEDCRIIRDCLEKIKELNNTQYADVFLVSENGEYYESNDIKEFERLLLNVVY